MKIWQRRTLGILAAGGGAVGFAASLSLLFTRGNILEWIFCIAAAVFYSWGIWCGVKLLEAHPGAERSNFKYWLVQVPALGSPIIGCFLSSGFHVTASIQFSPLKVNGNFLLGSTFNYSLMQPEQPVVVGVNVFALLITMWLGLRIHRQVPAESFASEPFRKTP